MSPCPSSCLLLKQLCTVQHNTWSNSAVQREAWHAHLLTRDTQVTRTRTQLRNLGLMLTPKIHSKAFVGLPTGPPGWAWGKWQVSWESARKQQKKFTFGKPKEWRVVWRIGTAYCFSIQTVWCSHLESHSMNFSSTKLDRGVGFALVML